MKTLFNRNFLVTSLMVLLLFAFSYIATGHVMFSSERLSYFSSLEAGFLSGTLLSIGALYIGMVANKRKPLKKLEIIFLFSCIILFLLSIYSILSYPEQQTVTLQSISGVFYFVDINITIDQKIVYIVQSFFTYFLIIVVVLFIPRQKHNYLFVKVIYYLVAAFALVAMLYSFAFEFGNYLSFIKDPDYANAVRSFFPHRNNFGAILTIGVIALIFLLQDAKKVWVKILLYVLMGLFFIESVFTLSKLNIILIILFILSFGIAAIFKDFKKHLKRNFIILGILGFLIILGVVSIILGANNVADIFVKIYKIFDFFVSSIVSTASSRYQIWCYSFNIIGNSLILGVGKGLFNNILLTYNLADLTGGENTSYAHNAYIEMIGQGGILFLCLYFVILGWIIYQIIKNTKGRIFTRLALSLLIFYTLFTGCFESRHLLNGEYEGTLILLLLLLPCFALRKEEIVEEVKTKEKIKLFNFADYFNFNLIVAYLLSTIIFCVTTTVTNEIFIANAILYSLVFAISLCFININVFSYFKNNNKKCLIKFIINFVLLIASSVILIFDPTAIGLLIALILTLGLFATLFINKNRLFKYLKDNFVLGLYPIFTCALLCISGYNFQSKLLIPFDYVLLVIGFIVPVVGVYTLFKYHQYYVLSVDNIHLFSLIKKDKQENLIKSEKINNVPKSIKPKQKDRFNSLYEKTLNLYKTIIEFNKRWWNRLIFGNAKFQLAALLVSLEGFLAIIVVRDICFVDLPDFVIVICLVVSLCFLNKKNTLIAFIFLISFNYALPLTTTMLIFAIFLFIRNECRLNIAQLVIPSFILIYEIIMIVAYQYSNFKDAFSLFLFVFNISYILLSRNISLSKKTIIYSYAIGVLLMLTLDFIAVNRIMIEVTQLGKYSYLEMLTDNYFRLSSPIYMDEWLNLFGSPYDFSYRSNMIGDDPNNLGYFICVAVAGLFYILKDKKKRFVVLNSLLIVVLTIFALLTKSRTFFLSFALIFIVYIITIIVQKEFSKKGLMIFFIIIFFLISLIGVFSIFSNLIQAFIWRFINNDGSFTNLRFELLGQYYFIWASNPMFRIFGSGVTNIYEIYGLELYPHTGIIQILCSFGLFGTLILFAIFIYIVYIRVNSKRISLLSFIPFIGIFVFTLGLQIIDPFSLLLPLVVAIMVMNNGSTINDKLTNNFLLTPIIYLKNKSLDVIDQKNYELDNKWPTIREFKIRCAIYKLERKQQDGCHQIYNKNKFGEGNELYNRKEVDSYLIVNKRNVVSKVYIFIDKIISKIKSFKISKFISHNITQHVIIALGAALCYAFIILTQVTDIGFHRTHFLISLAILMLLLKRNNIIILFVLIIPFSNGLPQQWLLILFLVIYIIKSKLHFTLAQLLIPTVIGALLLVNVGIYGTSYFYDDVTFIIAIYFLFYVALDRSLRVNIRKMVIAFAIGFIIYCLVIVAEMIILTNYALSHATIIYEDNIWNLTFSLEYRFSILTSLVNILNSKLKPDPIIVYEDLRLVFIDNANNIAFYAIFAACSLLMVLKRNKKILNILILFLFAGCIYFGIWTQSRAFMITLAVFVIIYIPCVFIFTKINKLKILLVISIVSAGIGIFLLFDRDLAFTRSMFDRFGKGDALGNRGLIIKEYIAYFMNHISQIWFGIGLNNVLSVTGLEFAPHTNLLQIFTSFGVVGGLFIILSYAYAYFMRINFKKLNVMSFLPLVVAFVFTLTIQILAPFMIMYPFLLSTLFINGGDVQENNRFKIIRIFTISLLPFSVKYKKGDIDNITLKENEVLVKLN